jgi:Uma2 family endonuclease
MMQTPFTLRRWSRLDYDRLVEQGAFDGEPIELIGGQLIVAEPQGTYHATALGMADDAIRAVLPPGWFVRNQLPLSLDDESAPEPDLAVVPGTRADYLNAHPAIPPLIIEVADASLGFDRRVKGSVYARAGVGDYWIVNVTDRALEVYREPVRDPTAPWGWSYRSVQTLRGDATIAPLALPDTRIGVTALLPPG